MRPIQKIKEIRLINENNQELVFKGKINLLAETITSPLFNHQGGDIVATEEQTNVQINFTIKSAEMIQ